MIQPPTDNLYKFLAIFGLVIVLASGAAVYHSISEWRASLLESEYVHAKAREAYLVVGRDRLSLINQIADASKRGDETRALALKAELDRLTARDTPLFENPEVKKMDEMTDALHARSQFMLWVATACTILGVILLLIGFQLWYFRVQVHLDRKLAAEGSVGSASTEGDT